ncbi:MAG TPA: hypothetical protein PLI53_07235 [Geobacteraceae bacterium]|nr:hypothetical protein [Geobacteraceae bacterium]
MAVDPIRGSDKMAPVQESMRMAYRSASGEQQAKSGREKTGDTVSVSLQRSSSTLGKLDSVTEERNVLAKSIRESDKALQEVSKTTVQMKERLDTIVKNYPPFPQDSVQRKELLMSYVSLRKEIEKMTFPPPPAPTYEGNPKLWDELDLSDTQVLADAIPELTQSSEDSQLFSAINSLDELQKIIGEGRKELYRTIAG